MDVSFLPWWVALAMIVVFGAVTWHGLVMRKTSMQGLRMFYRDRDTVLYWLVMTVWASAIVVAFYGLVS